MTPRSYFLELQQVALSATFVAACDLAYQEINATRCYINGILYLKSGHQLYVAEFVVLEAYVTRLKYRYHLQHADGVLVARWDNAPHHPTVPTFPDHKHAAAGSIEPSPPMDLASVLAEIPGLI